jgi:hypothetical protein
MGTERFLLVYDVRKSDEGISRLHGTHVLARKRNREWVQVCSHVDVPWFEDMVRQRIARLNRDLADQRQAGIADIHHADVTTIGFGPR